MTNEQIATEVMGWGFRKLSYGEYLICKGGTNYQECMPDFLNDHNAAMMVVEKMREDGWKYCAQSYDDAHAFQFNKQVFSGDHFTTSNSPLVLNKSLCHAICEAALKAKGG